MPRNWIEDIEQLYQKHGLLDQFLDGEVLRFRQRHLEEELVELDKAILNKDPEGIVDAIIDLCVVAIGTLKIGKVDPDLAWTEVLRANSEKERGIKSNRPDSKGFDLVKPENWVVPSHKGNTGLFDAAVEGIHARKIGFKKDSETIPSHVKTMDEWREFSFGKNHDYNDQEDPEFQHASYYPDGINNIVYELWKKVKRIRRNLKRMYKGGDLPKTEGLRDSFRDINIYSAIGGTYLDGNLEGQTKDRDIFNREIS